MKRLSVITPAYFAKPFIQRTIDSVLGQRVPDGLCIEHIIVADDLQDYSELRIQKQGHVMRFGSTGRRGAGPSSARNVGMAMATGDYVSFLDADDIWHPERVARLLPDVEEVGAATCRTEIIHDGDVHGRPLIPFSGDLSPAATLRIDGGFCPIYKMEHADHRWDESIRFAEDVVFNLRAVLSAGELRVRDEQLMTYVVRPGSLSHTMPQACILADDAYGHFLEAMSGWMWLPENLRAIFHQRVAEKRRVNRNYLEAWGRDPSLTFEQFVARDDTCK